MDHSSHDHGAGDDGGGHSGHPVIFFTGTDTSLFSEQWTPSSQGAYAGTCIFLIVLAALLRCIIAARALLEQRWADREAARRYVVVAGRQTFGERLSQDTSAKDMVISANGVEENVRVVEKCGNERRPWRFSVDPVRACIDTVITGVGYLLMLAVMTMNVGYFMSVLGGVFLGSLAVGRFTGASEH